MNRDTATKALDSIILTSNRLPYTHLKIFVDSTDETLIGLYKRAIEERNEKIVNNPQEIDAGFDLYLPTSIKNSSSERVVQLVDLKVICCAQLNSQSNTNKLNTGYYMYPRSSIYKTPVRMANNVGIIDAGYRGHICAPLDVYPMGREEIPEYTRLFQICAPNLGLMYVEMVSTKEELNMNTARGEGGFGSTGGYITSQGYYSGPVKLL